MKIIQTRHSVSLAATAAALSLALLAVLGLGGCDLSGLDEVGSPPIVRLEVSNASPMESTTVTFTAHASDPDGDSLSFTWYVDEILQEGHSVSEFDYNTGIRGGESITVRVVVRDLFGNSRGALSTITVRKDESLWPVVSLDSSLVDVFPNQPVDFNATASSPSALEYSWKVDGSTKSGTGTSARYSFSNWGTSKRTVRVAFTATDENGRFGTATREITVKPASTLSVGNSSSATLVKVEYRFYGLEKYTNWIDDSLPLGVGARLNVWGLGAMGYDFQFTLRTDTGEEFAYSTEALTGGTTGIPMYLGQTVYMSVTDTGIGFY
ncbi:MAG: hypothetical protein JXA15_08545 [Spirochaetales bacterium]|nr:hypothetical protein [Spirochaetales bacterium]